MQHEQNLSHTTTIHWHFSIEWWLVNLRKTATLHFFGESTILCTFSALLCLENMITFAASAHRHGVERARAELRVEAQL